MTNEEQNELEQWLRREVENNAFYSVGYHELRTDEERKAYKMGLVYTVRKTMTLMLGRVDTLNTSLKYIKQSAQEYKNDLETLSNILNKYKNHEE